MDFGEFTIPRTPVNKGKRKGRSTEAPAASCVCDRLLSARYAGLLPLAVGYVIARVGEDLVVVNDANTVLSAVHRVTAGTIKHAYPVVARSGIDDIVAVRSDVGDYGVGCGIAVNLIVGDAADVHAVDGVVRPVHRARNSTGAHHILAHHLRGVRARSEVDGELG